MSDASTSVAQSLRARYTIERVLGQGGMATVHLAHDLKHDRKVAIKVLRPELAAVLGAERFLNEIKVTANLQHPHILPLHDSGEADSFLYYVMPYVEGESLREKLNREKQLSIDEALKIASEVADALGSAHRQGVIHRDIKPENILLREGHALVADFGIALAVKSAGGERLTETGLSLGTPAYMSPEQVAGDHEIDGRSDIYSLACVLYEMLAGDPPFMASTPRAVLAKHVTDPAPPITTVRPGVSQSVAAAITKALGKAPVDRFESAQAFSEGLYAEAKQAEPEIKSIVVLPFENLSPDPDNAFFADGLTEELIAELSGLRELRVISRTSAMQFKDTNKGVPAIARELNVRYALEGSVRRAGNSVRITAQLIDASTDSHLWAERYTGKLDDIFDLQESLSRRIVEALKVTLTPFEEQRLAARPINDLRAYDAWLRARQEMWKLSKEGFDRGLQLISHALEITGDNALLYAALGYLHTTSYDVGISHDAETLVQAEVCANRALDMDPDLGLAHYAKAYVRYKEGNFQESVRLMKRAAELDHSTDAQCFLGFILGEVGRIEEARHFAEQAFAADPLHMFTGFFRACVEVLDGNFDEAIARFQRVLDAGLLNEALVLWWLAQSIAWAGREDQANEVFAQVAAMDAGLISDLCELYCRSSQGDQGAVKALLESKPTVQETAKTDEWFPNFIAVCLARVGDMDGALEWLECAIGWGFSNHRFLTEHNRFLAPLRGDPRFEVLIERARKNQDEFDE